MSKYENMSDDELLDILNSMADDFESETVHNNPVQQEPKQTSNANTNANAKANANANTNATANANNVNNWDNIDIELEDAPSNPGPVCKEPEYAMPVDDTLYTIDKDGNIIFSNMRPTQQSKAYRITPEKAVIPEYGFLGHVEKYRKALFESKFGMSYSYRKSWEALLYSIINEFRDARAVNIFGIKGGMILAKNLEIDPNNFVDDRLGITLYDLINFHVLFKELPNIEKLVLDAEATKRMVITYGDKANDIWKLFQESPSLRVLRIFTSTGWKEHRRDDFSETAKELEKELEESRVRAELQYKYDVINPRKSEMTKGYAYRVKENAKDMRNHSFGVAKEAFMDKQPRLIKSIFYSGLGLGLAGVGLAASVIHGAKLLIKPR